MTVNSKADTAHCMVLSQASASSDWK